MHNGDLSRLHTRPIVMQSCRKKPPKSVVATVRVAGKLVIGGIPGKTMPEQAQPKQPEHHQTETLSIGLGAGVGEGEEGA